MKTKLFALKAAAVLTVFILVQSPALRADHIIGSDISYECSATNDSIYDVTFNFYRDCNGCYVLGQSPKCGTSENCASSQTAPTSLTITCNKSGQSLGTFTMTRTGIVDITKTCANDKSRCQQPCNGSFPHGIEKHTFKGKMDLRNAIKAGCCDVEISVLLYVRNVGITTGQSQQTFYTFSSLNPCVSPCNSSPTLTNDPVAILCCNQPYIFNNGAVDFKDHDSLSYSFAPAYRGRNQICTYTSPNSPSYPINAYYPGSLSFPYSNPSANPPIGLYLDAYTGDIALTPVKCNQVAVVVMEIKEWRKDSNGVYQVIGVTRRDMQFIVMTCPENNPPSITNSKFTYSVCEGQEVCFVIETDDKVYVPPPPAPTPDPDTVTLTWNRGIAGATFTILDTSARLKKARFCWTPPIGSASTLPYTFTATATDDACPKNASATRAFSIRVKPLAQDKRFIDTLECGEYRVHAEPSDGFQGNASYQWRILDSTGTTIFNRDVSFFKSTQSSFSFSKEDTIKFRKGGKYIIRHEVNNMPNNCPNVYFDTLVVPPMLEIDLALGPDTFACAGEVIRLQPQIKNATQPLTFTWDDNSTKDYLDVSMPPGTIDTAIGVFLKDGSGCVAWDSTIIYQRPNPIISIGPDRRICWYDTIQLNANYDFAFWDDPRDTSTEQTQQGDTLTILWTRNGFNIATDTSITGIYDGIYIAYVTDSMGCMSSDTMYLLVNDVIVPDAGPDQVKCWNDELTLAAGGLDTAGNGKTGIYRWYDISSSSPGKIFISSADTVRRPIYTTTDFMLEVSITEDTTTCVASDTVNVKVNPLPVLTLPGDQSICCDAGTIALSGQPSGGKWYDRKNPGYVDLFREFVTSRACNENNITRHEVTYVYTDPVTTCTSEDSFTFTVNPLPKMRLEDGYFCQDKEVVNLANDIVLIPANLGPIQNWNCVDCGSYNWSNILFNQGNQFFPDYILRIGEQYMPLGNKESDSIRIELTYGNPQGCFSKDTATVVITKVPKITIPALPELCWNDGMVNLNQVTGVTPNNGKWMSYDTSGIPGLIRVTNDSLNGALKNNILDTRKTVQTGGKYYLRYLHTASGCPVWRDTIITIWPLPVPQIAETPFYLNTTSEPFTFCVVDNPVNMTANPTGGTFSSNFGGAITGSSFRPGNSPTGSPFWIKYSYTDPATGCMGADSVRVQVYDPPSVNITQNDTAFCRYENMRMNLVLEIENSDANNAGMIFQPEAPNTVTTGLTRTITIPSYNDSERVFSVVGFANDLSGVCPEATDVLTITTHPVPDVNITPDDPDGCEPHFVMFTTSFLNNIDNTTATYNWDFSDGGTSNTQNPTYGFNRPGTNPVSLTVTSAFGCDTTAMIPIDVYPNPIADFIPDPNNLTTAALPKFTFNNKSRVNNVLGASINRYSWDFGDPVATNDTSGKANPVWVYGTDTATYYVRLNIETVHGCTATVTKPVIVGPDILVFIPNAFTPNESGPDINEGFRAVTNDGVKTYHMFVFNRWGELLWESSDPMESWDGTYKGVMSQPDVYAYYLEITGKNDKTYKYSGTFTLMR